MAADETLRGSTDRPGTGHPSSHCYPSTAGLSRDDHHRVLASDRRRHVLQIVAARPSPVALEALAAAVVAREGDDPADETAREHAAISLHHVHLPLLDEHGVVEYDTDERRIAA
ncbi:DUF7344 domain-containing protein [Halobaculum lipolyticum]|uniref:DUF7344 domain-containing protein n=1 Tax=Halobaculum lipolyticum TaxID=3032001 RepID=A0ABD5WG81_9EURY|nr:hypothetical protein [Halobaculum sp. DT31]